MCVYNLTADTMLDIGYITVDAVVCLRTGHTTHRCGEFGVWDIYVCGVCVWGEWGWRDVYGCGVFVWGEWGGGGEGGVCVE